MEEKQTKKRDGKEEGGNSSERQKRLGIGNDKGKKK